MLAASFNWIAWCLIIAYFICNLLYSGGLKKLPIVDVAILVSGFVIRVLYGAAITDIEISKWMYLTVISMSFYMGLGKRRNEMLQNYEENTRDVLKYYGYGFLDKNMYVSLTLAITFYALWSVDPITTERIGSKNMIWTVPILILICLKYSMAVEGTLDGDPVEVVLKDRILLLMMTVLCLIILWLIYF